MRRIRLSGVLVLALVALSVPASTNAASPTVQTVTFGTFDEVPCDGFSALVERELTVRETTFYDASGSPTRSQAVADVTGTVTNSATGKTVQLRGSLMVVSGADGSVAFNGQVLMATDPGSGVVVHDSGRFGWAGDDFFEAGPHDAIDTEGQIFCTAVA